MIGERSLGYWYRETIHSYSHHRYNNGISDDESIELSEVDGRRGHRSLDTIHSSSRNCVLYQIVYDGRGGYRYKDTIQYLSRNHGVCNVDVDGRGVARSKETSRCFSCNHGSRVDVYGRGGYMSHTSHSSSRNPGCYGIFFSSSFYSCTVDENLYGDEKVRYSGNGAKRGDIGCDDGDGRIIEVMMMVTILVIECLMMTDRDIGLKRPVTLPLKIWEKLFMMIVEVDIGPRPSTIPPITQVTMVDFCVYLLILVILMIVFMKM